MHRVGLICEYNPFHNGHLYHIKKIKELFPDSILILVLNGYFLERGEISILSKEDKTKLSLLYGIDLVVELPVLYGTQSADTFAESAVKILNYLKVTDLVIGSECNDSNILVDIANKQNTLEFNEKVKEYLKQGVNYPTALAKAVNINNVSYTPNDLLGISYAKAIIKLKSSIKLHTILRTNDYHDTMSNESIISAKNIREKIKNGAEINSYVPKEVISLIQKIDYELFWNLLKHTIITSNNLENIVTVDEGIEKRLKKEAINANSLEDFIFKVKTKRYTYNKISRMLIHILLGFTKEVNNNLNLDYIHILGFNKDGQDYLKKIKKDIAIPIVPIKESPIYLYEQRATLIYEILTNHKVLDFEYKNQPIIFDKNTVAFYNENK